MTDLLTEAPASQIVKPVQDALAALPGVGHLLDELGVTTLVDDVVGVVDATSDVVGGVVENTVPPVISALDPTLPGGSTTVPAAEPSRLGDDAATTSAGPAASASARDQAAATPSASALLPVAPPATPATSAPASDDDRAPAAPPAGAPAAPTSSAGSGGASALSHARISDVGIPALRAVERASGAPDDVLPTSLVADTDVSPD